MAHTLPRWMYSYSAVFFTLFRALLGLLLFVKGIYFVFNHQHLGELIEQTRFSLSSDFLAYLISIVHLVGGAFIALGLLTRISIIFQLPVLFAAIIFNMAPKTSGSTFELFLALFILVLLVCYLIKGPGIISMDAYRKTKQI
ncbi:MAG: DoxX family protein [Segetibacter sp.]